MMLDAAAEAYSRNNQVDMLMKLFGVSKWSTPHIKLIAVDKFALMYYFGVRNTVTVQSSWHSQCVHKPEYHGHVQMIKIRDTMTPAVDVDGYGYDLMVIGGNGTVGPSRHPRDVMPTTDRCVLGPVTNIFPLYDWFTNKKGECNNWKRVHVGPKGRFARKKDWLSSLWVDYELKDGVQAWPAVENNFAALYWRNEEWLDGLEKGLAFSNIGNHRVKLTSMVYRGEPLPYVVGFNDPFGSLEVRTGFARYGTDMYFTSDGVPAPAAGDDGWHLSSATAVKSERLAPLPWPRSKVV